MVTSEQRSARWGDDSDMSALTRSTDDRPTDVFVADHPTQESCRPADRPMVDRQPTNDGRAAPGEGGAADSRQTTGGRPAADRRSIDSRRPMLGITRARLSRRARAASRTCPMPQRRAEWLPRSVSSHIAGGTGPRRRALRPWSARRLGGMRPPLLQAQRSSTHTATSVVRRSSIVALFARSSVGRSSSAVRPSALALCAVASADPRHSSDSRPIHTHVHKLILQRRGGSELVRRFGWLRHRGRRQQQQALLSRPIASALCAALSGPPRLPGQALPQNNMSAVQAGRWNEVGCLQQAHAQSAFGKCVCVLCVHDATSSPAFASCAVASICKHMAALVCPCM